MGTSHTHHYISDNNTDPLMTVLMTPDTYSTSSILLQFLMSKSTYIVIPVSVEYIATECKLLLLH